MKVTENFRLEKYCVDDLKEALDTISHHLEMDDVGWVRIVYTANDYTVFEDSAPLAEEHLLHMFSEMGVMHMVKGA